MLKSVLERGALISKSVTKTPNPVSFATQVVCNRATFQSSQFTQGRVTGVRYFSEGQERRPRYNNSEREGREGKDGQDRRTPPITSPVLVVRGLPWSRHTVEDVESLFTPIKPSNITIIQDPVENKPVGIIFVEFESIEDTKNAIRRTRNILVDDRNVFVRTSTLEEKELAVNSHKEPSLVVTIKKLPFSATEEDVQQLLAGINYSELTVGDGNAFIKFKNAGDKEKALALHGSVFSKRPISVYSSSDFDLQRAASKPQRVIRVRGAPANSTEDDIRAFFKDLNITRVTHTSREGLNGRPVPGDMFIEFATPEEATNALKLNRQNLGDRFLQIFKSSTRERRFRLEPRNPTSPGRDSANQE